MKSKFCLYFLFVIFSQIGSLHGQDIIILKTGDSIKVVVIQMDFGNTYYKDYNKLNESIKSLRNNLIKEIAFESYANSYDDDFLKTIIDRKKTKSQPDETDMAIRPIKRLGIGGNIFPILDISADYDISDRVNLDLGVGIGYIHFGGKVYQKSSKSLNRFYIGCNLFISVFKNFKLGLHLPVGIDFRSKNGLYLRLELGPLISSKSYLAVPRLGAGLRF